MTHYTDFVGWPLNLLKLLKIYSKNALLDSQNELMHDRLRIEIGPKMKSDRITLKSITKKIGPWYYYNTIIIQLN